MKKTEEEEIMIIDDEKECINDDHEDKEEDGPNEAQVSSILNIFRSNISQNMHFSIFAENVILIVIFWKCADFYHLGFSGHSSYISAIYVLIYFTLFALFPMA
jgi:hypothetical protein